MHNETFFFILFRRGDRNGGKGNRHRATSSSTNGRHGNSSNYASLIGNTLADTCRDVAESLRVAETVENMSGNSSHNWTTANHLSGTSGRSSGVGGDICQPGSGTASLRSRQSTQSGGSNCSAEGGWVSHIASGGSDNVSSITSTTVGSVSTASAAGSIGVGGNGVENCSTSIHSAGSSGQTPSCRALAGSLTSFDTSQVVNTEGNKNLLQNQQNNLPYIKYSS